MFINKDSFTINGYSMGQYLLSIKYQRPKMWGDDTGRNLDGDFSGTLKGVFPKFVLTFRKMSQSEVEFISDLIDTDTQTIGYYSPKKRAMNTITTYAGDWEYDCNMIGRAELGQASVIARVKEV